MKSWDEILVDIVVYIVYIASILIILSNRIIEKAKKNNTKYFKRWMKCLTKMAKHKGTIQTQEFLIDALKDEIKELKEKLKKK